MKQNSRKPRHRPLTRWARLQAEAILRQYPDRLAVVAEFQSRRLPPHRLQDQLLVQEVETVHRIASTVAGGKWYSEIILVACYGMSAEVLASTGAELHELRRAVRLATWFTYWADAGAIDVMDPAWDADPRTPSPPESWRQDGGDDEDQDMVLEPPGARRNG